MLKVGITGGIASGKTTVAEMFRARGFAVLDADRLGHEAIQPGQPAYDAILRAFGREVAAADGSIDRERLGQIVFADPNKLAQLNRIVHPWVIAAIEKEFQRLDREDPSQIAFVEAALLVEAGYHERLDKLIVTWCRPEQQLERLMSAKKLPRDEAERRIAAQLDPEEKRRWADFVIDCSGSLEQTEKQVVQVLRDLRDATQA